MKFMNFMTVLVMRVWEALAIMDKASRITGFKVSTPKISGRLRSTMPDLDATEFAVRIATKVVLEAMALRAPRTKVEGDIHFASTGFDAPDREARPAPSAQDRLRPYGVRDHGPSIPVSEWAQALQDELTAKGAWQVSTTMSAASGSTLAEEARIALAIVERLRALVPDAVVALQRATLQLDDHFQHGLVDTLINAAAQRLHPSDHVDTVANGEVPANEATSSAPATVSPLKGARERGMQYAIAEWGKPANLTLADAARKAGCSDRKINSDRIAGRLYALIAPNKSRGYRYPDWQFELADPTRLAAVLAAFAKNGASCWVIHNFMSTPLASIGGATPTTWIQSTDKPLEPVLSSIAKRYHTDQGAG